MISSETVPAWVVGANMIAAGLVWIITRKHQVRMDSRILGATFLAEGLVYIVAFQFFGLPVEVRGFLSRVMIIVLCLSQYLPLSVSYIRQRRIVGDNK